MVWNAKDHLFILKIVEEQVLILVVHHQSNSCIQFYFSKQWIVFYFVSNFEEFLGHYLSLHTEISFLLGCYDLPCRILLLGR